jgi:uncharacterized protein with PQ loop repeat
MTSDPALAALLSATATLIVAVSAIPQIRLVFATTRPTGVSVTAAFATVSSCTAWSFYCFQKDLTVGLISSLIAVVGWCTIGIVTYVRTHNAPRAAIMLWPVALIAAGTVFGLMGLAVLLVGDTLLNSGPQLLAARRDPAGVSAATWTLTLTGALLWVGYGLLQGDMVFVVSSTVRALLAASISCLVLSATRAGLAPAPCADGALAQGEGPPSKALR